MSCRGRFYSNAGWYTHILLWLAMGVWGYTTILFGIKISYGARGLALLGGILILANIVFAGLKNKSLNDLVIPFPDGNLELKYGWSFYLNLFTGIVCLIGGLAILIYEKRQPYPVAFEMLTFKEYRSSFQNTHLFFIQASLLLREIT